MSKLCLLATAATLALSSLPSLLEAQRTEFVDKACHLYVSTDQPKDSLALRDPARLMEVTSCLDSLTKRVDVVSTNARLGTAAKDTVVIHVDGVRTPVSGPRINDLLIAAHYDYKQMKRWVPKTIPLTVASGTMALWRAAQVALNRTDEAIHEGLKLRNLNQVFSAALVSGAVITSGNTLSDTEMGDNTKLAAHLVWESKHFRVTEDDNGLFDFSLRGKLGYLPALVLVQEKESTLPPESGAESVYQEALVWDMGLRLNLQTPRTRTPSEFTLVGRIGQAILGNRSVLTERGVNSTIAFPVSNGTGSAEWFFETGFEFSIYNTPIEFVHAEGSAVSPMFTASFVMRRDNRFKKQEDLVVFDSPETRGVFRFMLDALKVIDKREAGEKPKVFTVGFGVEHEFAWKGKTQIPSGTQLVLRGDLNLLRAIQGDKP